MEKAKEALPHAQIPQSVTHTVSGDSVIAVLKGEIDHHRAGVLRGELDELIRRTHPQKLYLDMRQIDFCDSSGLGLIMGRYALLSRLGGELIVFKPSGVVARMLSLAGMERLIRIET